MGVPVPRRRQSGENGGFLSQPNPGRERRQIVSAQRDEEHSRAHEDHVGGLCGLAQSVTPGPEFCPINDASDWRQPMIPSTPEVIPMAAPAPAKERLKERLSLAERIQRRAYELYVQRGNESGSELDDWLQAEEEIRRAEEEAIDKR